ncbi:hypothetical protein AMTRI_Chr12g235230 [Amborella trichopoda]
MPSYSLCPTSCLNSQTCALKRSRRFVFTTPHTNSGTPFHVTLTVPTPSLPNFHTSMGMRTCAAPSNSFLSPSHRLKSSGPHLKPEPLFLEFIQTFTDPYKSLALLGA